MVDEKNTPARRLYEKEGFESVYKDPKGTKVKPSKASDLNCVAF